MGSQLKNSYIPLKVNQGGIMPLVFSSTIAVFLAYPVQQLLNLGFVNNSFLSVYSITINILLVFPLVVGNVLQVNIFKNVTSLLILIGVITDVTSQIRGYLVARKYEGFK